MTPLKRILLDEETLHQLEPQEGDGQNLVIRLSVYDIPKAVTAREAGEGLWRIDFVYPDDEEEELQPEDGPVRLRTGRHSGKIMGLDVRVRDHAIERIDLLVQKVRQNLPRLNRPNQRLNYQLIENVLREKGEELFANS
jgi:hypothetical protein